MSAVMGEKDVYLSSFEALQKALGLTEANWLRNLRTAAIDRFAEVGFPTLRDEEWRFTSLAALARTAFSAAEPITADRAGLGPSFSANASNRLVFVNGFFSPQLSSLEVVAAGVEASSLARALHKRSEWIEAHLAQHASFDDHPFRALNTAFFRDGAWLYVPRGKVVEQPIFLVFITIPGNEPAVSYPRILIHASSGSALSVVEAYVGHGEATSFTNAVTEIVADDGAMVDHYKLQRETGRAFHLASMHVRQDHGSHFSSHAITLGGGLVRNEIVALLDAEGCECTLNGLYLANGRQHVDNRTTIDHAQPRCASHELYKGILDGKAHGVFNGKIYVRQDAQKTDAKQTNKTLLLSDDATINTKPQLEIYADDVKCTHGATVGQLDPESLFYLRTRGIDLASARSLLTFAFANDIVERIKVEPLRSGLENYFLAAQRVPGPEQAKEA